jgi:hypothetical protein
MVLLFSSVLLKQNEYDNLCPKSPFHSLYPDLISAARTTGDIKIYLWVVG